MFEKSLPLGAGIHTHGTRILGLVGVHHELLTESPRLSFFLFSGEGFFRIGCKLYEDGLEYSLGAMAKQRNGCDDHTQISSPYRKDFRFGLSCRLRFHSHVLSMSSPIHT